MITSVRKLVARPAGVCSNKQRLYSGKLSLREELDERQLVYQVTDEVVLDLLEMGGHTVYMGIDPTGDSLHSGHLKPLSYFARILRHGNKGILLLGGATARIGDPSGRDSERNIIPEEELKHNLAALEQSLKRITDSIGISDRVTFVNNEDWYKQLNVIDFFSQVGTAMRLSVMLGKNSVKRRLLLPNGLNFQEFSYQAFQAYDFLQLYKRYGCIAQLGGGDQWGNITAGCDLVRKVTGQTVYGLTTALLVDSKGNKLGKSMGGHPGTTLWLAASKTAPYTLYQSLLNLDDPTSLHLVKQLLPCSMTEVRLVEREHLANPSERATQKRLASEVIRIVHGDEELRRAVLATRIAFGNPSHLNDMEVVSISKLIQSLPHTKLPLQGQTGKLWTQLLVDIRQAVTLDKACTIVSQSLRINGLRVSNTEKVFDPQLDILKGDLSVVRIGKSVTFISWQR